MWESLYRIAAQRADVLDGQLEEVYFDFQMLASDYDIAMNRLAIADAKFRAIDDLLKENRTLYGLQSAILTVLNG